jgi:hypothetical protein
MYLLSKLNLKLAFPYLILIFALPAEPRPMRTLKFCDCNLDLTKISNMALRSLFAVTPALRVSNSRAFSSIPRAAFRTGSSQACKAVSKKPFARPSSRFYATEPAPQKGSGSTVWILLGLAVAAGGGYYFYTSSDDAESILKSGKQSVKAAAGFTPKFEDYQKVYNKIAGLLDEAGDYDGEWLPRQGRHFSIYLLIVIRWLLGARSCPSRMAREWNLRQGLEHWWQVSFYSTVAKRIAAQRFVVCLFYIATMLPCDSTPRLYTVLTMVWLSRAEFSNLSRKIFLGLATVISGLSLV